MEETIAGRRIAAVIESEDEESRLLRQARSGDAEERALHLALDALPERLRLPILLHFFEGLSGAEVAVVLSVNPSTVWSRIYAGCRALRKSLEASADF